MIISWCLVHQEHEIWQTGKIVEIALADRLAQRADSTLVLVDLVDVENVDDGFAAEEIGAADAAAFFPGVAGYDDRWCLVPNLGGSRPVDKVAASLVSWLGGGVQPANRSKRGMFDDAAPIWTFKQALGAKEDPEAARAMSNGIFIAEVFPALAIPSLVPEFCGRLIGARYNPGRRKTFKMDHWSRLLECTATSGSALGIDGLGDWCRAHGRTSSPTKSDQDLLDAVLCAIIGYIWMFEPRSASLMIGDVATGYMIAPAIGVARERLTTAAAARGVPCV